MRLTIKTILIIATISLLTTSCPEDTTQEFEPTGTIDEDTTPTMVMAYISNRD